MINNFTHVGIYLHSSCNYNKTKNSLKQLDNPLIKSQWTVQNK